MKRIALVTGASSGIGRDVARELSKVGYDLILVGRNAERLNELKDEFGENCKVIQMDLSNTDNCKKLFEENKNIDLLVNNAGLGTFGKFDETDLDKEINIINTNITAMHILAKLYLKEMKRKDSGLILNVASIAAFLPGPLMATYYASKAYVLRLSDSVRAELKKDKSNVRICVLCPGPVDTNFNNVAGVRFNLHSLSSQYVAKYTVNKLLNGKYLIIPGLSIKIAIFFSKLIPFSILSKFVYKSQTKKINKMG